MTMRVHHEKKSKKVNVDHEKLEQWGESSS